MADKLSAEADILRLSKDKFLWKTERDMDKIAGIFDDDLVFIHFNAHVSSKKEWLAEMSSGRFIYNKIELREASAKVYGDTAILVGKAIFSVMMNGSKGTFPLVYTEVYIKKDGQWKLSNLHICSGGY